MILDAVAPMDPSTPLPEHTGGIDPVVYVLVAILIVAIVIITMKLINKKNGDNNEK